MTKNELGELLDSLNIPIAEGIQNDKDTNAPVRICYWEYVWEPLMASDKEYNTNVTYQISVFADMPRHKKLLELKKALNNKGIYPIIQHEYVAKDKRFHSYFAIEVQENVE